VTNKQGNIKQDALLSRAVTASRDLSISLPVPPTVGEDLFRKTNFNSVYLLFSIRFYFT